MTTLNEIPPQYTHYDTESAAVHSLSEGWLPAVLLTFHNDRGDTITGLVLCRDLMEFVQTLAGAGTQALLEFADKRDELTDIPPV